MRLSRSFAVGVLALLCATTALASWYDDYDAGVNAAHAGKWSVVIQRMTAAINANSKESDNAREYGAIFINYHPYYYRGVAYLQISRRPRAAFPRSSGRSKPSCSAPRRSWPPPVRRSRNHPPPSPRR